MKKSFPLTIMILVVLISTVFGQGHSYTVGYASDKKIAHQLSIAPYAIDEHPTLKINDELLGIWKMREDTNYHDYFVVERDGENAYCISYMNRGGDNRRYEHDLGFISEVNNTQFFNVASWDRQYEPGYVFLKIISISTRGFELTAAYMQDLEFKGLKNSKEVKDRIARNMSNPSIFSDTLHFIKKLPMNECR